MYAPAYPQTIVQRPVTTLSRPANNYAYGETQYLDYYNYAPDRSYSTTFSTNP